MRTKETWSAKQTGAIRHDSTSIIIPAVLTKDGDRIVELHISRSHANRIIKAAQRELSKIAS